MVGLRILIQSTSVVPVNHGRYGGAELMATTLAEALVKHGEDVTIAAPVGSNPTPGAKLIETVRLPEEQDRDDLAIRKVIVDGAEYDIIHDFSHGQRLGQDATTNSITPVLPSAVFMLWDPVYYRYEKSVYNQTTRSEWQRERYERLYGRKGLTMPAWCDAEKFHPENEPLRERFLFLGKISHEKGVHLAIRFAKELGVGLDVCGGLVPTEAERSWYLEEIRKLADGEQIRLHWNITENEKIRFLQDARATIYPVLQDEGHWLAGIESWLCGTPTITFDRGAMREVCPEGSVVQSPDEFKQKMKTIEPDRGLRDWAFNKYSVEKVLPVWLSLYREVVMGKRW